MRRGPGISAERNAPRALQVGLLTPCNLACHFCYRDTAAESRLTEDFLVDLLQKASAWGVLEVAFGGGEPLLFPGLVSMLQTLHETTPLGLNMTTNGVLLRGKLLDQLAPLLGEVRVSAYPNNRYRQTLQRTRSLQTGLNLLVTPQNVGIVSAQVHDALRCGADNVLLLGYKGADPDLHLGPKDRERLRAALEHMRGLPLRLDICLYPHFADLPHLFPQHDCGAGDDFLTITPDRAVQSCSFSTARRPFETFEDLQGIYAELKRSRPEAGVGGCTRAAFKGEAQAAANNTLWTWSERAGNNSGTYTIIADFCDEQTAKDAAEILRKFFYDVHRYYQEWNQANGIKGDTQWAAANHPTLPPPVVDFIDRYELDLDSYSHSVLDDTDAPSIVGVGKQLLLHHGYCLNFDDTFFRVFFEKLSGSTIRYGAHGLEGEYVMLCTAKGDNPAPISALEDYLTDPDEHAFPPWMEKSDIEPLWPHDQLTEIRVDRQATEGTEQILSEDGLRLCIFLDGNLAAAAACLQSWLKGHGYQEITVTCGIKEELSP